MFRTLRKLLAPVLFSLLACLPAKAEQPGYNGSLISTVMTSMAGYRVGEMAHVQVNLKNNRGAAFTGTIQGYVTGRGRQAGPGSTVAINNLAAGASQSVDLGFIITNPADFRGYQVALTVFDSNSQPVDNAGAAFSVESSPYVYPRYCFSTQYFPTSNIQSIVDAERQWQCNGQQFMDVGHRQATPYINAPTWTNLSNTVISGHAVTDYAAKLHAKRAFSFLFEDMGITDSTVVTQGEPISLAWLLYTAASGQSLSNVVRYPDKAGGANCFNNPDDWLNYGWQSSYLPLVDPTNAEWQRYYAQANLAFIRAFGMDGFNMDTLGDPACTAYRSDGSVLTYSSGSVLGAVYNGVRNVAHRPAVLQDELQAHLFDMLAQNPTFYLSELHPNFAYPNNFHDVAKSADNIRIINPNASPVFMVYSEEDRAQKTTGCSTGVVPNPCFFNNPGVLYKEDAIAAGGAWPMDITDGNDNGVHIVSDIYAPATYAQLAINPALLIAEQDRRNFYVANEKILRGKGVLFDANHALTCTSGAVCATTGEAGKVFVITASGPGMQIAHLLNYQQLTTVGDMSDTNGAYPAPTVTGPIAIKMYYGGSITGTNNTMFLASPDINHGSPETVTYSKGSDSGGNYVLANIRQLGYDDLIWIELDSIFSTDYSNP